MYHGGVCKMKEESKSFMSIMGKKGQDSMFSFSNTLLLTIVAIVVILSLIFFLWDSLPDIGKILF